MFDRLRANLEISRIYSLVRVIDYYEDKPNVLKKTLEKYTKDDMINLFERTGKKEEFKRALEYLLKKVEEKIGMINEYLDMEKKKREARKVVDKMIKYLYTDREKYEELNKKYEDIKKEVKKVEEKFWKPSKLAHIIASISLLPIGPYSLLSIPLMFFLPKEKYDEKALKNYKEIKKTIKKVVEKYG